MSFNISRPLSPESRCLTRGNLITDSLLPAFRGREGRVLVVLAHAASQDPVRKPADKLHHDAGPHRKVVNFAPPADGADDAPCCIVGFQETGHVELIRLGHRCSYEAGTN